MDLTEDSFRALARSSPWRWRSLHFIRRPMTGTQWAEAWIRRPGELRVVDADGRETVQRDRLGQGSMTVSWSSDGSPGPEPVVLRKWPHEVEPLRRPDGLVAERPDSFEHVGADFVSVDYGDPMYNDYYWVAMLDPAELGSGTVVGELAVEEHRGRPVWAATVSVVEGYEPRCGCCALLWSEVSDRDEYGDNWAPDPTRVYPSAYRVAVDVETGVLVSLTAVDAEASELDLEILDAEPWP